jgi:hypothetical protein
MDGIGKLARDIGAAPLGDLIASVGRGVAEAQAALDRGSLEQTLALYDQGDDLARLMRETGYRPTFYAIPETEGELTLALTVTGQGGAPGGARPIRRVGAAPAAPRAADLAPRPAARVYAAPVDGGYSAGYAYTGAASAKIKFRIVAVPPSSEADALRVVPDFTGLEPAEAAALAASLDLSVEGEADGPEVTAQSPAPGALAREGDAVALRYDEGG